MSRGLSQKMSRKFSGIPKPQRCCAVLMRTNAKKLYRPKWAVQISSSNGERNHHHQRIRSLQRGARQHQAGGEGVQEMGDFGSAALHPETRRIHRGERQHFTGPNFRPSFIWDGFTISPPIKLWTGAIFVALSQIWVKVMAAPWSK